MKFSILSIFILLLVFFEQGKGQGISKVFKYSNTIAVKDVAISSKSSLVLVGESYGLPGNIFITDIDTNLNVNFFHTISDLANGGESGRKICSTRNGDYIISTGGTTSAGHLEINLLKTDSAANIIWFSNLTAVVGAEINDIIQLSDGSYMAVGSSNNFGSDETLILNLDTHGILIWGKTFSGFQFQYDKASKVYQVDSFLYVFGTSLSFAQGKTCVMKLDLAGNVIWSKIYFGNNELLRIVTQTTNKNFLLSGIAYDDFGASSDTTFFIASIDTAGTISWVKTYRSINLTYPYYAFFPGDIISPANNKIYLSGAHYIMRLDSLGNLEKFYTSKSNRFIPKLIFLNEQLYAIGLLHDTLANKFDLNISKFGFQDPLPCSQVDTFYVKPVIYPIPQIVTMNINTVVDTFTHHAGMLYPAVLTDSIICDSSTSVMENDKSKFIKIYPNPADKYVIIERGNELQVFSKMAIIDLYGNVRFTDIQADSKIKIDTSYLADGIYSISLFNKNSSIAIGKLCVIHQ